MTTPTISGVSGTVSHGSSITVSGANFGSKGTAAPEVWDDCTGTNVLDKWTGKWPSTAASQYNVDYRTTQRSVPMPHSRISKYMCGCFIGGGFDSGNNVIVWRDRTLSGYPSYYYASWYQQYDPGWTFGLGSPADDNLKFFAVSKQPSPSELPNNWYISFNNGPPDTTSVSEFAIVDDDDTDIGYHGSPFTFANIQDYDRNSKDHWWELYTNPFNGHWFKYEVEMVFDSVADSTTGLVKMWEDCVLKMDYQGRNHIVSHLDVSIGIGGFARSHASTNFTYFADLYVDNTRQRICLGNNASYNSCTVREMQIPTAWSGSSITATVNLATFNGGATVYLFVVNELGEVSSGFQLTADGAGGGSPGARQIPKLWYQMP
jgi:hypothetical protein